MKIFFLGDLYVDQLDSAFNYELIAALTEEPNSSIIINLEGVLPSKSNKIRRSLKKVDLSLCETIVKYAPPTCYFNLVNNHSGDYGYAGYLETVEILNSTNAINMVNNRNEIIIDGQKIIFFGDEREQCQNKKYGFNAFDKSSIIKNKEKIENSLVVIHGGLEYRREPTVYQRYLAQMLVDLGAIGVIFIHSHTKGIIEMYKNRIIHYGLGNFYFSKIQGLHGENSSIYGIKFDTINKKFEEFTIKNGSYESCKPFTTNLPNLMDYKLYYRNKYKIEPSLRPRQLFFSEMTIKLQYKLWISIANPLVRLGISKKIKRILKIAMGWTRSS